MTPEQALAVLENATASLQTTRENHLAILQAISVLHELVAPPTTGPKGK